MHLLDHPGPSQSEPGRTRSPGSPSANETAAGCASSVGLEGFLVQLRDYVVDHERAIGELAHPVDLRAHPFGRSEHGADAAQAAGI